MLAAIVLAWSSLLFAREQSSATRYDFDVPRGSLISAFAEISNKTGLQIGTSLHEEELRATEVGPISGSMTVKTLLDKLLAGTGLSFSWVDQYTIRVFATVVERPQAEDGVQTVTVTGSRLSGETAAPRRMYERDKIEGLGVSTLPNLARYMTQQSFSFGSAHLANGAQHFQMRGLGFDTTLVLINGRRVAPSAISAGMTAFDLNGIPLTAVERIEVMSDSASAVYGADAVGGVVNIITRKEIQAPEVYVHLGDGIGGGDERRAAISVGSIGRFRSSLVLDYFEQDQLLGQERSLWRDQDYRRYGGQDYRTTNANPGNVYLLGGLLPGLSSSTAGIPSLPSGGLLSPSDFISTAGEVNRESLYRYRSLSNDVRRATAFGSAEFDLMSKVALFGELLAANDDVVWQRGLPTVSGATVPASNPFNPFKEDVLVDYLLEGAEPVKASTNTKLMRLVLGARGSALGWDWELTGLRSSEQGMTKQVNDIDAIKVASVLASTDAATTLNLFSDGAAASRSVLASLRGDGWVYNATSKVTQLSGFVRASFFVLPGGDSEFIVGGELRSEAITARMSLDPRQDADESRDVSSAFAEIRLPVVSKLSLNAALRRDQYSGTGDSVNPQYGILWRPLRGWTVRASYGTSFRPASLLELGAIKVSFPYAIADPRRNEEVAVIDLIGGGNPHLKQVTARSLTAGAMFTPLSIPGLKLAANYWQVKLQDSIIIPMQLLYFEDKLPGRVTRANPSQDDIALGRPGVVQSMDVSFANFGGIRTNGIDIDASYLFNTSLGKFHPSLSATWVHEYISGGMFGGAPVDRVGIANNQGSILPWRVVGSMSWAMDDRVGLSATATYRPSYEDSNLAAARNGETLSAQMLVDLQGWFDLSFLAGRNSALRHVKLTLGVLNLFDRGVEFAEVGGSAGYDESQGDMTGRFAYLRLSSSF